MSLQFFANSLQEFISTSHDYIGWNSLVKVLDNQLIVVNSGKQHLFEATLAFVVDDFGNRFVSGSFTSLWLGDYPTARFTAPDMSSAFKQLAEVSNNFIPF